MPAARFSTAVTCPVFRESVLGRFLTFAPGTALSKPRATGAMLESFRPAVGPGECLRGFDTEASADG